MPAFGPLRFPRSPLRRCGRPQAWWVLLWVLLSQFPLPMVHSHSAWAADDPELASHLRAHHASLLAEAIRDETSDGATVMAQPDSASLHWHLVLPWLDDESGSELSHAPSPMGLWGAGQAGVVDSHPCADWAWICDGSIVSFPDVAVTTARERLVGWVDGAFMKSFAGVRCCALICVARC